MSFKVTLDMTRFDSHALIPALTNHSKWSPFPVTTPPRDPVCEYGTPNCKALAYALRLLMADGRVESSR